MLHQMTIRGRVEWCDSRYSVYAGACIRGGVQADLAGEIGWWQTPLWQYALFAVVSYSRAAADRLAVPLEEVARRNAARHDLEPSA